MKSPGVPKYNANSTTRWVPEMSKRRKTKKKEIYDSKWDEYFDQGLIAQVNGDIKKFVKLMYKALQEGERVARNPESEPDYLPWMIDDMLSGPLAALGIHYLDYNKPEKARQYLERAIELDLKSDILDQDLLDERVHALSEAYDTLHLHSEDIEHCNRMLEYLAKRFGVDSPDMIPVLRDLAQANESLARFDPAENIYKRMIAIAEKHFGENSPEYDEALDELEEYVAEKDWAVCDCHPLASMIKKTL